MPGTRCASHQGCYRSDTAGIATHGSKMLAPRLSFDATLFRAYVLSELVSSVLIVGWCGAVVGSVVGAGFVTCCCGLHRPWIPCVWGELHFKVLSNLGVKVAAYDDDVSLGLFTSVVYVVKCVAHPLCGVVAVARVWRYAASSCSQRVAVRVCHV